MSKLRVHSFGMSIDGYGAGPNRSFENPLGVGGLVLHKWAFKTRSFHAMVGAYREAESVSALFGSDLF